MSEILKSELDAFCKRTGRKRLNILETGSIRGAGDNYRLGDGWSTVTFAEYVKKNGGKITSIDYDIDVADQVLRNCYLISNVELIKGGSIDVIAGMVAKRAARKNHSQGGSIDVLFLDSGNDASLTLREYLAAIPLLRSPALVMVDDVDMESHEFVKGHEIVPFIHAHGIRYRIVQRDGDGFSTGILVFET